MFAEKLPPAPDPRVTRLAQRGAEHLARFILTLAEDDNGIRDYVRAFIAGDDLPECVASLRGYLATIREGERAGDRRHGLDEVFLRRLDHLLDAIELVVLPVDPRAAFDLLVQVIESDEAVVNFCHEARVEPTFERAGQLPLIAAKAVPPAEAGAILQRLAASDDYSMRGGLRPEKTTE